MWLKNKTNSMLGINPYGRELTWFGIKGQRHRGAVGGMWDEIGELQYQFVKKKGLSPQHRLLDVGCGCLRGGINFMKFLEKGNYYGFDVNESFIKAGKIEIKNKGLIDKEPNLLVNDNFDFDLYGESFDVALALSVFTHLPINNIIHCLLAIKTVLKDEGTFYATFFEAPEDGHIKPLQHTPGDIITYYNKNPYHYSFEELSWMADIAGMRVDKETDWKHPRNQKMVAFKNKKI